MTRTSNNTNIPPYQQDVQRRVDAFNADEAHWLRLERRRRLRRKLLRLTTKQHEAMNQLEFAATRPPDDCIASRSLSEAKVRL